MRARFFAGILVTTGFLFGAPALADNVLHSSRCAGGDGPHPLFDVSDVDDTATIIPTQGGVQEFSISEGKNNLIYRNEENRIIVRSLTSGTDRDLAKSTRPMSRVRDQMGQFILTEGAPWLLDVPNLLWHQFTLAGPSLRHLFFGGDTLFSLTTNEPVPPGVAAQETYLHYYTPGASAAERFCTVKGLRLGEGHQYPYVVFYRMNQTPKGEKLTVVEVDVRRCGAYKELEFLDPMEGPVLEVHRFADLDATAVLVDNPKTNLLWDRASQACRYYNVQAPSGDAKLLVLNYHRGILGSFSKTEGLRVIYPSTEKQAHILKGSQIEELSSEDTWLTNAGDRLFLAPRLTGYEGRPIMQIEVREPAN